jgi:DNA-3-methyladenine glycosylase
MPDRAWFERHPVAVAFDLLGCELIVERDGEVSSGRIVELEAYGGPEDLAAHSGRLNAAKPVLFGEPGHLYVYRSYGIHTMVNMVSHGPGRAGGVLIRALEPMQGVEFQERRRGTTVPRLLTRGPGVLCQALGLTLEDNRYDIVAGGRIRLQPGTPPENVLAGPRIGISRSVDHPWRLFDAASRMVSSHRRGTPVDRAMIPKLIEAGEIS